MKEHEDLPLINKLPKPFLKWVGGKRQLLPELFSLINKLDEFNKYHEPFVGGGALFFELSRMKMLSSSSYLYDINANLINAYLGVKNDLDSVIKMLKIHQKNHSESYYYKIRSTKYRALASVTSRIIYLNKTCFNGLFRENSKGEFNVPIGRYKNPKICDVDNLIAVSQALEHVKLFESSFDLVLKQAKKKDLVYFDPPYHPISKTSNFTSYSKGGFTFYDQLRLSEVFKALDEKGVRVILSNSDSDKILKMYQGFTINKVMASRNINSVTSKRGKILEVLISNF